MEQKILLEVAVHLGTALNLGIVEQLILTNLKQTKCVVIANQIVRRFLL